MPSLHGVQTEVSLRELFPIEGITNVRGHLEGEVTSIQRGELMTTEPVPANLNNHQKDTLAHIFRHPVGHNIEWHAVLSLLEVAGTVEETHGGRFLVTLGDETETFEAPKHKDIDPQQVVDLRRMLKNAGYGDSVASPSD
jgi:hypothetical protein